MQQVLPAADETKTICDDRRMYGHKKIAAMIPMVYEVVLAGNDEGLGGMDKLGDRELKLSTDAIETKQ